MSRSPYTLQNVKPFSSNKLLSANNFFFHIKNYDCSIQH